MDGFDLLDRYIAIPLEWEETAKEWIPMYMFYQGTGRRREGWCTFCEQHIKTDYVPLHVGVYPDFWTGGHNNRIDCPHCGRRVIMKHIGKLWNGNSLDGHQRLMFPFRIHENRVILRCFYIEYTFTMREKKVRLSWHEDVRYDLTPGEWKIAEMKPDSAEWRMYSGKVKEPWPLNRYIARNILSYFMAEYEGFEGTFLRYLPFERIDEKLWHEKYNREHDRTPWGKLLCMYCMYPSLEMVIKEKWWDLVTDLVCFDKKNHRIVNWKERELHRFLRMNKAQARKVRYCGNIGNVLDIRKTYGLSEEEAILWDEKGFAEDPVCRRDMELREHELHLYRYLIRQGYGYGGVSVWKDYLRFCRELGRDTEVPSIQFPKNLSEEHDRMHEAVEAIKREKEQQKRKKEEEGYQETREWYRKIFAYNDGVYTVLVPETLESIVEEGRAQMHCVAGYVHRHAGRATVIVFIRKESEPNKPLYTVEVSPTGALKQAQGFRNRPENAPKEEAKAFMDKWLAEVQRRLALEEKKNKKEQEAAS